MVGFFVFVSLVFSMIFVYYIPILLETDMQENHKNALSAAINKSIFYIAAISSKDEVKFHAIDSHSGGYPFWADSKGAAKPFASEGEAIKSLNCLDKRDGLTLYVVEDASSSGSIREVTDTEKAIKEQTRRELDAEIEKLTKQRDAL